MLKLLNERQTRVEWIGPKPGSTKRFAMLVPQYNEYLRCDLERRLKYYKNLAEEYRDNLDLIIIDDGSTDNSLKMIAEFCRNNKGCFYLAAVTPNANKVGALFIVAQEISNDVVILTDFDTDIVGLDKLINGNDHFGEDDTLMGFYFRMLPWEGSGNIFLFQQLEYALARSLYKFHRKDGSITVMPGAGSCFNRKVLTRIYEEHSGLRNGEDREATLIGLRLGYKAVYMDDVSSLTRPPLSFRTLVRQRVRWNLGYLQTFHKERKYYFGQIGRLSRIGVRTLADLVTVTLIGLLPYIALILGISHFYFATLLFLTAYCFTVVWYLNILSISSWESREFKSTLWMAILMFPIYKVSIEYCAWTRAILKFIKLEYVKGK